MSGWNQKQCPAGSWVSKFQRHYGQPAVEISKREYEKEKEKALAGDLIAIQNIGMYAINVAPDGNQRRERAQFSFVSSGGAAHSIYWNGEPLTEWDTKKLVLVEDATQCDLARALERFKIKNKEKAFVIAAREMEGDFADAVKTLEECCIVLYDSRKDESIGYRDEKSSYGNWYSTIATYNGPLPTNLIRGYLDERLRRAVVDSSIYSDGKRASAKIDLIYAIASGLNANHMEHERGRGRNLKPWERDALVSNGVDIELDDTEPEKPLYDFVKRTEAAIKCWDRAIKDCQYVKVDLGAIDANTNIARMEKVLINLADAFGINDMLDAYDVGVPVEDIIA